MSAAQLVNHSTGIGQFEQIPQDLEPLVYAIVVHPVDPAEIEDRLFDGELVDQRDVLRHVADARPQRLGRVAIHTRSEHGYVTLLQLLLAHDARQQRRLTTPRRAQQSITVKENVVNFILRSPSLGKQKQFMGIFIGLNDR